jgi:hypothetical protein
MSTHEKIQNNYFSKFLENFGKILLNRRENIIRSSDRIGIPLKAQYLDKILEVVTDTCLSYTNGNISIDLTQLSPEGFDGTDWFDKTFLHKLPPFRTSHHRVGDRSITHKKFIYDGIEVTYILEKDVNALKYDRLTLTIPEAEIS